MNYQSLVKGIEAGLDLDPLLERELKRIFSQIDQHLLETYLVTIKLGWERIWQ